MRHTKKSKLEKIEIQAWNYYHQVQKTWRTDTKKMIEYKKRWETLAAEVYPINDGADFFVPNLGVSINFGDVIS